MYENAFKEREDLKSYGDNALLLFSLILRFGIDDIQVIANDALTDGNGDKKADLVYVNSDEGYAIIAQGHYSKNSSSKKSAPSNKASDLNTAVTWLLSQEESSLPDDIKSAALQLRKSISDNEIKRIELWYVHNLSESKNCFEELKAVESTVHSLLDSHYPNNEIDTRSIEVGEKTLNDWYQSIKTPILVDDEISINISGGYSMSTDLWNSFCTSISCAKLFDLFKKHETKLFSANIRDFLGIKKIDSNINFGIRNTVEAEPQNFWIFNNGITVITHNYSIEEDGKVLKLKGFSIVNGAQTTGSIGSLETRPSENTYLPARFVKCDAQDLISNIVRYNNSQNKITASDFRSNDRIQEKLRNEFKNIRNTLYTGGRRGGADDAIKRNANLLPSDSVAQSLAAFHLDPAIAYNRKSEIWVSDKLYSNYFNEKISANHICLTYSLFQTIINYKNDLILKSKSDSALMQAEIDALSFLRLRGANYILMAGISTCMEILISKPIPDKFSIHFKVTESPNILLKHWTPIVGALLSFSEQLRKPTENALKNESDVKASLVSFKSLVQATLAVNASIYKEFASNIVV
ncbi:AIPR family protein [Leptospira santarosai]|uniref:AIPR family protein n=1 Tax=Leptospira santarosai TaxID=28183 RepID=UPI0024AEA323|nr:AIPR family protein [Leptospira santarosai]MDI7226679.1 AIPR family protein [Leptospira santarosai]